LKKKCAVPRERLKKKREEQERSGEGKAEGGAWSEKKGDPGLKKKVDGKKGKRAKPMTPSPVRHGKWTRKGEGTQGVRRRKARGFVGRKHTETGDVRYCGRRKQPNVSCSGRLNPAQGSTEERKKAAIYFVSSENAIDPVPERKGGGGGRIVGKTKVVLLAGKGRSKKGGERRLNFVIMRWTTGLRAGIGRGLFEREGKRRMFQTGTSTN